MKSKKKIIRARYVAFMILVFLSAILVTSLRWCYKTFGPLKMDQLLFTVIAPVDGYDGSMVTSWLIQSLVISIFFTIFITFLIMFIIARLKKIKKTPILKCIDKFVYVNGVIMLVISLLLVNNQFDVVDYLLTSNQSTSIFEEKDNYLAMYVDPNSVKYDFQNSNNLIYIYLESVENTFMSTSDGGVKSKNIIPELTDLAKNNVSFSNNDKLGGSIGFTGTTWTIASMVSQSSGLPLKVEVANDMNKYNRFMPGATMMGDILSKEGYIQELMIGSDSSFAGTDKMFKQHGKFKIVDSTVLIDENRINSGDCGNWGVNDLALFREAKKELNNLALSGNKFNFTMATIDPHGPSGFVCSQCPLGYKDKYEQVMACQSYQVNNFVNWIEMQPWYANTTIIIVGDHNSMAKDYFEGISSDYVRTTYNCIINSKVKPYKFKNREFCQLDMFPTTLAAIGVKTPTNRLGLGTNLFSNTKTNLENYGYDYLSQEVQKKSDYLDSNIYKFDELK